jgi:hypothetical protein
MSLALYAKVLERGGFGVLVCGGDGFVWQSRAAPKGSSVDARGESRKCKCLLPSRHLLFSFNIRCLTKQVMTYF